MKNIVAASAVILGLALSGNALAGGQAPVAAPASHNMYIGFFTGMYNYDTSENGYSTTTANDYALWGFTLGMHFNPFDVGVSFDHTGMGMAVLANGSFGYQLGSSLEARIGAGIGMMHIAKGSYHTPFDPQPLDFAKSESHFAYQGFIGLGYHLTRTVTAYGSYHYLGWTRDKSDVLPKGHSNQFHLGVNIDF